MRLWFCLLATEETSTGDRGLVNVPLPLAMAHSLLPTRRSKDAKPSNEVALISIARDVKKLG